MNEDLDVEEFMYKILVVGDLACGKTSAIHRYVSESFSDKYRATIGVDFALKLVQWTDNTKIRLQLWDIAGQERFGHMTGVYYREAVGAFVVYDVTRDKTFEAVEKWKEDLDNHLSTDDYSLPTVLLANKVDLIPESERAKVFEDMDKYCEKHGFVGWFATSAKAGIGIKEAGDKLIEVILESDEEYTTIMQKETKGFKLADAKQREETLERPCPC